MKMFFTYLIATLLFSLCLLEKEARKSAVPLNISDKNYAQSNQIISEMTAIRSLPRNPDFQTENQLVAGQESNEISFPHFILADSLSFQIGLEKQENKVF